MPSIPLHPPPSTQPSHANPLPPLLHTPAGLAILEIQGTLHYPPPTSSDPTPTAIGRLVFPLYNEAQDESDTEWMKKVYLYIGQYQRLTGETRKLERALGVMGKREGGLVRDGMGSLSKEEEEEGLEIKAIVKYKIVFKGRPEPVGGESRV